MIEESNFFIKKQSSLLIRYSRFTLMFDAGWGIDVRKYDPDLIILSHAHPDHIRGLFDSRVLGGDIPIYCNGRTASFLTGVHGSKPDNVNVITKRNSWITLNPDPLIRVYPFNVVHSVIAPETGMVISVGEGEDKVVFLIPGDVLEMPLDLFKKADVYIGDASSLKRDIVRIHRGSGRKVGHASILRQLTWVRDGRRPKEVYLRHWGRWAVMMSRDHLEREIEVMASEFQGIKVIPAFDGSEFRVL